MTTHTIDSKQTRAAVAKEVAHLTSTPRMAVTIAPVEPLTEIDKFARDHFGATQKFMIDGPLNLNDAGPAHWYKKKGRK